MNGMGRKAVRGPEILPLADPQFDRIAGRVCALTTPARFARSVYPPDRQAGEEVSDRGHLGHGEQRGHEATGHETGSVYRRCAIVSNGDLAHAGRELQIMTTGRIAVTIGNSEGESGSIKAAS